jgi:hypothetical protein
LFTDGSLEELLSIAAPLTNRAICCKTLVEEIKTPLVCIPWCDIPQRLVRAEEVIEIANGMSPTGDSTDLRISAACDIFIEVLSKHR